MKKQTNLYERGQHDIEYYKRGAKVFTASPICEKCIYYIEEDASCCQKYSKNEKPEYVICCKKACPKFCAESQVNLKIINEKQQKLFGGILGSILGDAMGVPLEFSSRQERIEDPVKEVRAYGTHYQPYGTWSDDTTFMLCLVENIIEGISMEQLGKLFVKCYKTGYFTPHGEMFDIGNSTRDAINRIIGGMKPEECGGKGVQDNGNGSLMRVLPLAYYLQNRGIEKHLEIIKAVSSLTHAHKRSILACIIYVEIAINLLMGFSKEQSYQIVVNFVRSYCKREYGSEFKTYEKVLSKKVLNHEIEDIKSSGYVVDTLEAVLWVFMGTDNYEDAILKAINLGGDTDTIAAITGGLAGILYGFDGIPNQWLQYLEKSDELVNLIISFENSF